MWRGLASGASGALGLFRRAQTAQRRVSRNAVCCTGATPLCGTRERRSHTHWVRVGVHSGPLTEAAVKGFTMVVTTNVARDELLRLNDLCRAHVGVAEAHADSVDFFEEHRFLAFDSDRVDLVMVVGTLR